MPIHSLQRLSPTAVLGLWHLTETPVVLWSLLPPGAGYSALLPVTADVVRQAQWLAARVLTHALATEILEEAAVGLQVQNDASGRPWLAGAAPGMVVSLSHSGAWVAALLARGGRAGVDVEIVRDKAERLAAKFLGPAEAAAAQAAATARPLSAHAHYTLLWSAKETLYKLATRRGLVFKTQLRLDDFEVQEAGKIPATLLLDGRETRHHVCYCQPAPGYVLTYCHHPTA